MCKIFVAFWAEDNENVPVNDVIELEKQIEDIQDIKEIEKVIEDRWFGDGRKIVLLNYKKM